MTQHRFGDPRQLPDLVPLSFLDGTSTDRVLSAVMTLAAEVWALRVAVAELTGAEPPIEAERQAYVARLLDSLMPEPDPARPIRGLVERSQSTEEER